MEIVGIDFVGPLPMTEKGNKYVLTMQDHFTRFPVAYPLGEANELKIIECIPSFASDFGYPQNILSDQGSAFLSSLVEKACNNMGISHKKIDQWSMRTISFYVEDIIINCNCRRKVGYIFTRNCGSISHNATYCYKRDASLSHVWETVSNSTKHTIQTAYQTLH